MSKAIKVIDLLNKIANGEEVPKKIKFRDDIYEFDIVVKHYNCVNSKEPLLWQYNGLILNQEVETIEDEPEIEISKLQELKGVNPREDVNQEYINLLIKAVKQLDKRIKNK